MFWIISAGLILIALAILLPALLGTKKQLQDNQRAQNITIANEQLADLEGRYKAGEMNEEAYQSTRDELEQALFADVNDSAVSQSGRQDQNANNKSSLLSSLLIALLVPAISIPVYLKVGTPLFTEQLDSKLAAKKAKTINVPKNADGSPNLDAMVAGLQKKMDENPDNAKGWFMLGRSYMMLKRYGESATALDKSLKLKPDSAQIMLSLADALAMANNGEIAGRPTQLINNALEIEPENLTALWLGGMAARQQKNYVVAIERWQKVIPLIKEPAEITEVRSLIDEALTKVSPEEKLRLSKLIDSLPKANTGDSASAIRVTVSLSDEIRAKAKPSDIVFVYAKAMSGPPMPLAAVKKQVKDLPFDVLLDDSMAMMPSMTLSSHTEVIVGARISKSGQPIAQDGDLFTEKKAIKLGEKVTLSISSIKGQALVKVAPSTSNKAVASKAITVTVSLSEKLISQTKPNELVFIYAKALNGPPMPLAAVKKQVKDLPITITLDDSMAMMPALTLSGFNEVVVGARVSKTGRPISQNGDLFSEKSPVAVGDEITLEIDSILSK